MPALMLHGAVFDVGAVRRLRRRMQDITLTVALADYQRKAVLREIDEWITRESMRSVARR